MNTKSVLKTVSILMLVISLGLQAYIFLLVLYELFTLRHVGFGSGIGYGATLIFSIPAFLMAIAIIYGAKIRLPMKWIHGCYLGSHLFIVICIFSFPGNFD